MFSKKITQLTLNKDSFGNTVQHMNRKVISLNPDL